MTKQTLEQHILTKLKENKGVLVEYKDLHPYWLNYKKIEEKHGLINQIFTKVSKIRNENPNMNIKTIRMQGYVYEGEKINDELDIAISMLENDLKRNVNHVFINLPNAKLILKLLKENKKW